MGDGRSMLAEESDLRDVPGVVRDPDDFRGEDLDPDEPLQLLE